MGNDAALQIIALEAQAAAEGEETFDGKIRAAMRVGLGHWMGGLDEDLQFRGSIGGVLFCCNEEEKQRIVAELDVLKALGAATAGIPVNMAHVKPPDDPIGLMKIWKEVKTEVAGK